MKTNILKFALYTCFFLCFIFILKSCKKAGEAIPAETTDARTAAINAIRAEYGNVSAGIVYPINKKADDVQYKNVKGEFVSLYSNNGGEPPIYDCQYNCTNASNMSDLRVVVSLQAYERIFVCDNPDQNNMKVKWFVSAPFTPLQVDPVSGTTNSYGIVKITTQQSVTGNYYSTNPVKILTLGPDPSCITNTMYEVSYVVENIPTTYFANTAEVENTMFLYNDCPLSYYITKARYTSDQDSWGWQLPCERTDKVWFNPNGPNNCITATGNYAVCFYATGMTPIDYHQLEYRQVTAANGSEEWEDQNSTIHWSEPSGTTTEVALIDPYTGVSNLTSMTPASGNWLVRYRNIYGTLCIQIGNTQNPSSPNIWYGYWVTEIFSL